MSGWTDHVVGERMAVDQEFASRVGTSRFSSQEWSLVMTATEFEIENPDDPAEARLVANTENVEHILPELENVRSQVAAMGGTSGGGDRSGGIVDSLRGALGLGSGSGDYAEEREAAERLTQEYAEELQSRLEENGRWESVCAIAADESVTTD